jgi:hypothetical protein
MPPRRKATAVKKKAGTKKAEVQLPTSSEELAEVLGMMAVPDNDVLAHAVRILRKFIESPASVPALMEQLTSSPSAHTRQLAAILLHTRMRQHWAKLMPEMRSMIRAALLSFLPSEADRNVRNSTIGVIIAIATQDMAKSADNQWPELLQFVWSGAESSAPVEQEYTMFLLWRLMKKVPAAVEANKQAAKQMCLHYVKTTEPTVRRHALKALDIAFARYLEADEIELISQVVASLVAMIGPVMAAGDDYSLTNIFDILLNASSPMIPMGDATLQQVWQVMLTITQDPDNEMPHREKALNCLGQILRTRPGSVTRLGLAPALVSAVLALIVEPADNLFDQTSEATGQTLALDLLNIAVRALPQGQVFLMFLPGLADLFGSGGDEHHRKGALVLFASLANGCADALIEYEGGAAASQLLHHSISLLSDPHPMVRTAACIWLCNVAEVLHELIVPLHETVMTSVFTLLANPAEDALVRRKSCIALEAYCDVLGELLKPYAPTVLEQIQQIFASQNLELHVMMLSVLRTVADQLGTDFLPHFAPMMAHARVWLTRSEEEFVLLRAKATESIGHMCAAVGTTNWVPEEISAIFSLVIDGFSIDDSQLHDLSYVFFRKIITAWGPEMPERLYQPMFDLALASVASGEGFDIEEDEEGGRIAGLDDDSSDDDDDAGHAYGSPGAGGAADAALRKLADPDALKDADGEEAEDVGDYQPFDQEDLRANVPALEAKVEAFRLIQQGLESLGAAFPSATLEDVLNNSFELLHLPYIPLRTAILQTFGCVVEWMSANYPLPARPQRGEVIELPEAIAALLVPLNEAVIEVIIIDSDAAVVTCALNTWTTIVAEYGMAMLPENDDEDEEEGQVLRDLFIVLGDMAKEDSACQIARDLNDLASTNNLEVVEAMCCLFGQLAKAMGTHFVSFFDEVLPSMAAMTDSGRHINFRTGSLGTIAEMVLHMGPVEHANGAELARMAAAFLSDPSLDMQRHACYLASSLALTTGDVHIGPLMQSQIVPAVLATVVNASAVVAQGEAVSSSVRTQALGAVDNSTACLIKLAVTLPALVPDLAGVITTAAGHLAFRDDWEEMNAVIPQLPKLADVAPETFAAVLPHVVFACAHYFTCQELTGDNRALLVQWLQHLGQQYPGQVEQITAQLDQNHQHAIMTHLGQ